MPTNQLAGEKSPYLLQHAHNPVNWFPWSETAFAKARAEQKPIFLSVGYSTCHWCHVMERESFESDEIAEILNRYFISIKVDREERPDVDRIYMAFVQASTGSGGWPMSVWLTPELKPFFGGTYFPPDNRYGRPGFSHVLESLARAWEKDRDRIVQSGDDVIRQLESLSTAEPEAHGYARTPDPGLFDSAYFQFRRMFDSKLGGFGQAPKFPRPVVHNFLLRHYARTRNEEALDMVLLTLRKMARGGMNDQLGGGFHRYSVDERWFVPHFEKMLYDQAQLTVSYLEGFQISKEEELAATAMGTLEYVLQELHHEGGAFYSAEDADSASDPAQPHEKGEGVFYVWDKSEITGLLDAASAGVFCHRHGVEEGGNVHEDPHGEFRGKNILFQADSIEGTAKRFELSVQRADSLLRESGEVLLRFRARRPRPHLDDKILTAWNGLMISAFSKGAQVLGREEYRTAATRAANFVCSRLYTQGELMRRYRDGDAAIPGFLDDYAFFVQGLLDLYETCFSMRYLRLAKELTDRMITLFEDSEHGGFFTAAEGDSSLVMRMKDDYDGAEPSGNSVAVINLLRLSNLTQSSRYRDTADRALRAFASRMSNAASGMPQMLVACQWALEAPKQIVIIGAFEDEATQAFLKALRSRFLPFHSVLLIGKEQDREALGALHDTVAEMKQIDGKTTTYVCENFVCQLPTNELDRFVELLN